MLNHKRYMDIERLKPQYASAFEKGDLIYIQEKIDGANASFQYDKETNTVVAFSRNNVLGLHNNLRGFWEWTQTLNVELVKSILGENLRLFCEWLVPHSVVYPKDRYNKAYCYDVYNMETQGYLPQDEVFAIVKQLGLIYVPVFYCGEFLSWEHCLSFVGDTELGGEYGEGIVIKNHTRLNNSNGRTPFYTKIVGEKFQETKGRKEAKTIDPEQLKSNEENRALCETIVTEARVNKLLNKMVDEQILPEDWSEKEMSIVAKNLTKMMYEDCIKEENDTVQLIRDFGKTANNISMSLAKKIAKERNIIT